ncbi:MAG: hypothetical protein ACXVAX_10320 [Pseudobdellovibrio sp.]
MKKLLVSTLLIGIFPVLLASCVSTLLKESPPTFSTEIKVTAPPTPFVALKTSVFPSWKSSKSGNVISIVSECDPNLNSDLIGLHRIVEDSLTEVKVVKEENTTLQSKPAYYKNVTAELEGHPIEVETYSFKRKSCGYVTSLSGKSESLEQDKVTFEKFIQGLSF